MDEWRRGLGARILKSREHSVEQRRENGVVVSRIDFAIAGGGVERRGLSTGWGLWYHSAIGCLVGVDDSEEAGYRDSVDW